MAYKLTAEQLEQRRHRICWNRRDRLKEAVLKVIAHQELEDVRHVLRGALSAAADQWKDGLLWLKFDPNDKSRRYL